MNKFNWGKAIGYGVAVWAVMAILLGVLSFIEPLNPLWAHLIVALTGGLAAFFFGRNLTVENFYQNFAYSLVWVVIVVGLDLATTQWFDAHIFNSWQYWLGPALVLTTPLFRTEYAHNVKQYA